MKDNIQTKIKIGISGGTFDPIHNGHVKCARSVKELLGLDTVLFLPSGNPPHKVKRRITGTQVRLEMVEAAIKDTGFQCCRMEIDNKGYSYTVDTLRALKEKYGEDHEFYYIIGTDVLSELMNWKNWEEVFTLCTFVAVERPGYSSEEHKKHYQKASKAGANIIPLVIDVPDISSSEIRQAVSEGLSVDEYVAPEVAKVIKKYNLYHSGPVNDIEEIILDLKDFLSPHRLSHSIGVMEESERIAKIWGADVEKCKLAGILHDCARELTDNQHFWLGIDPSAHTQASLHGVAGAVMAKERYGIQDPEILEAIRVHTTGMAGMGTIAKVIFVADYTEKGRKGPHFDNVRQALDKSLDLAVLVECRQTIEHVQSKKTAVLDPQTVATKEYMENLIQEV